MKHSWRLHFFTVLLLVSMGSASEPMHLRALVDLVSATPEALSYKVKTESVRKQGDASRAYPAPTLGIEWGSRGESPGMSDKRMPYGGVVVGQEFMFPGKRKAMQDMEGSRIRKSVSESRIRILDMQHALAQSYLELQEIQWRTRWLDTLGILLLAERKAMEREYQTGMASDEGRFELQNQLIRYRLDSMNLVVEKARMHSMVASVLGSDSILLPESIHLRIGALPDSAEVEARIQQHPQVQDMQEMIGMAKSELRVAELNQKPDIMLNAKYMAMEGPDEWSLMAGVSLPFAPWSKASKTARIQGTQQDIRSLEWRLQSMQAMLRLEALGLLEQIRLLGERAQAMESPVLENSKTTAGMILANRRMQWMNQESNLMARQEWLKACLALERILGVTPGTWLQEVTNEP